jgi:hypothetical protein
MGQWIPVVELLVTSKATPVDSLRKSWQETFFGNAWKFRSSNCQSNPAVHQSRRVMEKKHTFLQKSLHFCDLKCKPYSSLMYISISFRVLKKEILESQKSLSLNANRRGPKVSWELEDMSVFPNLLGTEGALALVAGNNLSGTRYVPGLWSSQLFPGGCTCPWEARHWHCVVVLSWWKVKALLCSHCHCWCFQPHQGLNTTRNVSRFPFQFTL